MGDRDWMGWWTYGVMGGQMGGWRTWSDGWTDGWKDRCMVRWRDGLEWIEKWVDGWIEGGWRDILRCEKKLGWKDG